MQAPAGRDQVMYSSAPQSSLALLITQRSVERNSYSCLSFFLVEHDRTENISNKITSVVSQINTPSYLLQLKLILGFGRSETWSVSYLALSMFSNIYKGPNGRQNGHESCNLRSHLLNVTLDPSFGLFILSISQALSWTKICKTWPLILKGLIWQSSKLGVQSLQAGVLPFGEDPSVLRCINACTSRDAAGWQVTAVPGIFHFPFSDSCVRLNGRNMYCLTD